MKVCIYIYINTHTHWSLGGRDFCQRKARVPRTRATLATGEAGSRPMGRRATPKGATGLKLRGRANSIGDILRNNGVY